MPVPGLRRSGRLPSTGDVIDPVSLLPAIRAVAHQMHARLPASFDVDDLVQVGVLRVLERQRRAANDAAPYLVGVARIGMLDYLRSLDPLHHTDRRRLHRLAGARARVEHRLLRPARLAEVAAEAGVPLDDAATACDVARCGLDEIGEVADYRFDPAGRCAARRAFGGALARYLNLDPIDRDVVDDWLDDRGQDETAARLGVTASAVSKRRIAAVAAIAAA